jgi:hypothetical protein
MAGIVEARHGAAMVLRPLVEGLRLGPFHVGLESPEPEQARWRSLARPHGDAASRNTGSNTQEFQAKIGHLRGLDWGWGVHLHWRPGRAVFSPHAAIECKHTLRDLGR